MDDFCEDERNEDGGETKGNECRKHGEGYCYSHERAKRQRVKLEVPYKNEGAAIRILSNVSRNRKKDRARGEGREKREKGSWDQGGGLKLLKKDLISLVLILRIIIIMDAPKQLAFALGCILKTVTARVAQPRIARYCIVLYTL